MVVFVLDVLAQFVERPIEIFFFTGQKNPAWAGVKLLCVVFEPRGCVNARIDSDRDEEDVAANAVAQDFLNFLHVAVHRRADRSAGGEEGVYDDRLPLEHIRIKAHLFSVLVEQLYVSKILPCGRSFFRRFCHVRMIVRRCW